MSGRIAGRIKGPGVVERVYPQQQGEPEKVGGVLLSLLEEVELTDEARCAIGVGVGQPNPHCPCIHCHRYYGTI